MDCWRVNSILNKHWAFFFARHIGPDHLQWTLLNWDTKSVLALNKKWKCFSFTAKTLSLSQLSKVNCTWSGPLCETWVCVFLKCLSSRIHHLSSDKRKWVIYLSMAESSVLTVKTNLVKTNFPNLSFFIGLYQITYVTAFVKNAGNSFHQKC